MNKYGNFNSDGTEFVITDPDTPRDFDNFLFNNSIFSYVQQTGAGYNKYQIGDSETTSFFNVRRDVMYDRDSLMNRLVYIRDNDSGEFWNVNWEPVKAAYDSYRCIHGIGYTILETAVKNIESYSNSTGDLMPTAILSICIPILIQA